MRTSSLTICLADVGGALEGSNDNETKRKEHKVHDGHVHLPKMLQETIPRSELCCPDISLSIRGRAIQGSNNNKGKLRSTILNCSGCFTSSLANSKELVWAVQGKQLLFRALLKVQSAWLHNQHRHSSNIHWTSSNTFCNSCMLCIGVPTHS